MHMRKTQTTTTTAPVQAGDTTGVQPEFGRWKDVKHLYGIPRGTGYNLLRAGLIKGVLLRSTGTKSGLRLIDLGSVRAYIQQQEESQ